MLFLRRFWIFFIEWLLCRMADEDGNQTGDSATARSAKSVRSEAAKSTRTTVKSHATTLSHRTEILTTDVQDEDSLYAPDHALPPGVGGGASEFLSITHANSECKLIWLPRWRVCICVKPKGSSLDAARAENRWWARSRLPRVVRCKRWRWPTREPAPFVRKSLIWRNGWTNWQTLVYTLWIPRRRVCDF